jgi:hypothetical protein
MKIRNFFSAILACIFMAAAALAVYCCVRFTDARPILLTAPDSARNKIVAFMDAFCAGDFNAASQSVLGIPDLGMDKEPEGEVAELLWDAYLDSMSYELVGETYTTENGVAQTVVFTSLSMERVTSDWNQRAQALLEQRVEAAENTSDIYNENNEYREAFIMDVLYDAVSASLQENAELVSQELTLELQYQEGQWWIIADKQLLDALFGGIL